MKIILRIDYNNHILIHSELHIKLNYKVMKICKSKTRIRPKIDEKQMCWTFNPGNIPNHLKFFDSQCFSLTRQV